MLDDGQSQASAAGVARSAAIDPVKALGQARQMIARNANAIVSNLDLTATIMCGGNRRYEQAQPHTSHKTM